MVEAADLRNRYDFDVHLEQLDVGDYVIDGGIIVERKTYANSTTSLVGGRLMEFVPAIDQTLQTMTRR